MEDFEVQITSLQRRERKNKVEQVFTIEFII